MKNERTEFICPACKEELRFEPKSAIFSCPNSHTYEQSNGIPNLSWPKELTGNDALFFEQYKEIAQSYDQMAPLLFEMFFSTEDENRSKLAKWLEVKPGARVCDLSTGTGANIKYLRKEIGATGEIYAVDLSPNMLKEAIKKSQGNSQVKFAQCNASYLPFEDNYFDALLHVGGINTFTEIKRALEEINRVVKPGGKVVILDEGMAPWLLNSDYGKELLEMNNLYQVQPPLDQLPETIRDVKLQWALGNAYYVLEFRVAENPLTINREVAKKMQTETTPG